MVGSRTSGCSSGCGERVRAEHAQRFDVNERLRGKVFVNFYKDSFDGAFVWLV